MSGADHPDVAPYAQGDPLTNEQRANIVEHLTGCEECRDLVLFIRKTNATLLYEGRVSRVAKALRMSTEALKDEIKSAFRPFQSRRCRDRIVSSSTTVSEQFSRTPILLPELFRIANQGH